MKKIILALSVLMLLTLSACGKKDQAKEEIYVYNWGEYIDPSILKDFQKGNRNKGKLRHLRFQRGPLH